MKRQTIEVAGSIFNWNVSYAYDDDVGTVFIEFPDGKFVDAFPVIEDDTHTSLEQAVREHLQNTRTEY